MSQIVLKGEHLTLEDVVSVAYEGAKVVLSEEAWKKVRRAERAVASFVARGQVVYGVTTGFGAFKDHIIPPDEVQQLQRNILMSHAVGVGELCPGRPQQDIHAAILSGPRVDRAVDDLLQHKAAPWRLLQRGV